PPTPIHTLSLHDALPISRASAAITSRGKWKLLRHSMLPTDRCATLRKRSANWSSSPKIEARRSSSGANSAASKPPLSRLGNQPRSEEHTSELQSLAYLVC